MSEPNLDPQRAKQRSPLTVALPIFGLLLLVGILWWGFSEELPYGSKSPAETVTPVAAVPIPDPEPEPEPQPMVAFEAQPQVAEEPKAVAESAAAPTLAEANALLANNVKAMSPSPLAVTFAAAPNLIERVVAIIDNLRQGFVPYKLLPIGRPQAPFAFRDDGLAVTMDPTGFSRYDGLSRHISELNTESIVSAFTTFESAVNAAWNTLGYEDPNLEGALLTSLEIIMLAPETPTEARLYKVEANWVYEDPSLEALSPLQKQLMRMGPDNAERVKEKARELRGALLDR
jgi:hypothetical protein